MKMIDIILQEIKISYPRTTLHDVEAIVEEVFAEEANSSWRYEVAEDWGLSLSELQMLRDWLLQTDSDDFDDLWAEVGH
jgi:hypothetical protein